MLHFELSGEALKVKGINSNTTLKSSQKLLGHYYTNIEY